MHIITAVFLFTEPSSIGQQPFAELPKAANRQPHSNQQLQDSEEKEASRTNEEDTITDPMHKESSQNTKKSRSISESTSDRGTVILFREFKLLIFDLVDTASLYF